jgi:hypothetical protein
MDFMLRYRGPLPANGSIKDKHSIRMIIHRQLGELCNREKLVEEANRNDLPEGTLKGRRVEVPRPMKMLFFYVPIAGFNFVPIVHRPHELSCTLEVLFLRREKPGDIIRNGGDLDNRLKTLFDALRMPLDETELKGICPSKPNERVYCLLEDDSLITKVSVSTHQLLEPVEEGEEESDIELIMHVTVQSTYPMIGNLGF